MQSYSHFLEEIPEGQNLELLQDEVDACPNEEALMSSQGLGKELHIALLN